MKTRDKIEIANIAQLKNFVKGIIEDIMFAKVKNNTIKLESEKVKIEIIYEEKS